MASGQQRQKPGVGRVRRAVDDGVAQAGRGHGRAVGKIGRVALIQRHRVRAVLKDGCGQCHRTSQRRAAGDRVAVAVRRHAVEIGGEVGAIISAVEENQHQPGQVCVPAAAVVEFDEFGRVVARRVAVEFVDQDKVRHGRGGGE